MDASVRRGCRLKISARLLGYMNRFQKNQSVFLCQFATGIAIYAIPRKIEAMTYRKTL
jgi:hypothetical protein